MKLKKILVGMVALFLMFGTVTPVFAMIPPAESKIFTIDADPSEIQRVAFFIECSEDEYYYREVEGYLVPEGTKLTMDNEVFVRGSFNDGVRGFHSANGPYFGWREEAYEGFRAYDPRVESGSNTIAINYSDALYDVIAKKDDKTERMYFATDKVSKNCYRILEEGETADNRKKPKQRTSNIYIYDADGNRYETACLKEWIRPVTFEIDENGNHVELDGFIVKDVVTIVGSLVCQKDWNMEEYLGLTNIQQSLINGGGAGWYMEPELDYGWEVKKTLSMITYETDPFALSGAGLWIATEELTGITYRDRELKPGEMEVTTRPMVEEAAPIHLNKINKYLGTTADGEDIKKVRFKIGESIEEGYIFSSDSYVGINREVFDKGLYDEGYFNVTEDGIIENSRRSAYGILNEEGMLKLGYEGMLYHMRIIDPETGKNVVAYFAFDNINPNVYEVLEVEVEIVPETEEPESEDEGIENGTTENGTTENPAEASVVEVSAVAVAATVVAGTVSAAVAGIMPSVEISSGAKARCGELHVNGDVDVPDVHFDDLEKLVVPVHVSDGEGIIWAIVAKAFTPGIKDLVKVTSVPAGTDGANINLKVADDFKDKVKEETTVYLEVVATGFDVNGECNLLEKMVEVKIVTK